MAAKGNNFGLKTRDLAKAGTFAMNNAAREGNASYSTAATVSERWQQFASFAKSEGVKRLEGVTPDLVQKYAENLAEKSKNGELSMSYSQNMVSAVNTVMKNATLGKWQSVSPTKSGIGARSNIRTEVPQGVDRASVAAVAAGLSDRGAAVVGLARDFGLRSKEASLIDARAAQAEASRTGQVTISAGTKGGRARTMPVNTAQQRETLQLAAKVQGDSRSLVPASQSWAQWRSGELRTVRETLKNSGMTGLHELRAAYAYQRYSEISGQKPRLGGGNPDKQTDRETRLTIAHELGHSRVQITTSYIGSMK